MEYSETGLVINGKSFNNGSIIVAGEDDRIEIEGTIFRGYAEISKENGKLLVINNIGLEECVYSHVGRELSAVSPSEALKAQAVAARTFLLHEKQSYKNKDYDLNNLEKSRTYFGVSFENPQSIKATDNTAGIIVKYKGERAFTPYFANCGGYTEDVAEIWGAKMPYLSPVPCFFCKNGRHYTWEAEIQEDHIVASLNKKGYKVTSVSDINPRHEVTKSGRAKKIKLITNSGEIVIDLENFRQLVGYNLLKSARSLTARPRGGKFKFTGKGWGHGTGMCQEGAEGMAREGHKFKEILRRYYPGTEISSK
ncbi:MAG: SpoIID/LytB domain-containing protein [Candidatus Firestonebacteria bacterium]